MRRLSFLAVILAIIGCGDSGGSSHSHWHVTYYNGDPIAADEHNSSILDEEEDLFDHINSDRVSHGLNAFIAYPSLDEVARAHSIHMADHCSEVFYGFESLINPEGDSPLDRAILAGIHEMSHSVVVYAENISYGLGINDHVEAFNDMVQYGPTDVSYDNLHSTAFDYIGVGHTYRFLSEYEYYWTVDFLHSIP